jgi:hypothetical protein
MTEVVDRLAVPPGGVAEAEDVPVPPLGGRRAGERHADLEPVDVGGRDEEVELVDEGSRLRRAPLVHPAEGGEELAEHPPAVEQRRRRLLALQDRPPRRCRSAGR